MVEGILLVNKSLYLSPTNAFALRNRGFVYYKLDQYGNALKDLDLSLELEPIDVRTLNIRKKVCDALKQVHQDDRN